MGPGTGPPDMCQNDSRNGHYIAWDGVRDINRGGGYDMNRGGFDKGSPNDHGFGMGSKPSPGERGARYPNNSRYWQGGDSQNSGNNNFYGDAPKNFYGDAPKNFYGDAPQKQ